MSTKSLAKTFSAATAAAMLVWTCAPALAQTEAPESPPANVQPDTGPQVEQPAPSQAQPPATAPAEENVQPAAPAENQAPPQAETQGNAPPQGNAEAGSANPPTNLPTPPANQNGNAAQPPQNQPNQPTQPAQPNQPTQPNQPAQPAGQLPANQNAAAQPPNQGQAGAQSQAQAQAQAQATAMNLGATFATRQNQLVVSNVRPNAFFARAGFLPGDVIVSALGRPIINQRAFYRLIRTAPVGQPLPVVVLRGGQRQVIYLHVQQIPGFAALPAPGGQGWLGVTLDPRFQNRAIVTSVRPGSPADQAGVRPDDWIMGINGRRISGPDELSRVVRQMQPGSHVNVAVSRYVTRGLDVTLGQRPAPVTAQAVAPAPGPVEVRGYRGPTVAPPAGNFQPQPANNLQPPPPNRGLFDGDGRLLDRR